MRLLLLSTGVALVVVAGGVVAWAALRSGSPSRDAAIIRVVRADVASPAFGNRHLPASCFVVTISKVDATIAAVRLASGEGCSLGSALTNLIFIEQRQHGRWQDAYLGTRPRCWQGLPAAIERGVVDASGIQAC